MPRYVCSFADGDARYFFEWSTAVDAPVTTPMTEAEFRDYYRDEYGRTSGGGLQSRLDRAVAKGTSSQIDESLESLVRGNRAGDDESCLTWPAMQKMLMAERAAAPDAGGGGEGGPQE